MDSFAGRVAVVTGAAGGIGGAFVDALAQAGARLVLADVRGERVLEQESRLRAHGCDAVAIAADVRQESAVRQLLAETVGHFGQVDLVISAAGVASPAAFRPCWEMSAKDWRWQIEVNLGGVINLVRVFVPHLVEASREAWLVLVGATSGVLGGPFAAPYDVAEHGITGLAISLHYDLQLGVPEAMLDGSKAKRSPVGVTLVCPSYVRGTGIAESDDLRPEEFLNESEEGLDPNRISAIRGEWRRGFEDNGIPPADVARAALEGIRERKLYVFPNPGTAHELKLRASQMIAGKAVYSRE